jgi:hypothetical protein
VIWERLIYVAFGLHWRRILLRRGFRAFVMWGAGWAG